MRKCIWDVCRGLISDIVIADRIYMPITGAVEDYIYDHRIDAVEHSEEGEQMSLDEIL